MFDGDCLICNKAARRVRRLDTLDQIWLAPLQGETAASLFSQRPSLREVDSLIFAVERNGKLTHAYWYSDSIVELSRRLGGAWRIFAWLKYTPRILRDGIYKLVARFRRKIAKGKSCPIPDKRFRARLLP